ncbi:MAG: hypothetical protein EOM90_14355 [Alphaproteobacteria bacterium]|nr:hypothetical protein [Alphaproteobacteria bacterium]
MTTNFDKIASKISDCHGHFGKFRDDYYSPAYVVNCYAQLGVDKVCIMPLGSSSTPGTENEKQFVDSLPDERFVNNLWVTPEMYDLDPNLKSYDYLNYKMIKIHTYDRKDWHEMPHKIRGVIEVAVKKNIPVMFHTGGWRGSNAIQFYKFCREYPEMTFILAHGRPISQAITILKGTKNTYVDSSFLPIESIKLLCSAGLSRKIIFGTDFPIMKTFWPKINLITWYKNHVIELIREFGENEFIYWSHENFYKLILK